MSVETDVAMVRSLEGLTRDLLKAVEAAKPALERLGAAGYAGAEWVGTEAVSIGTDPQTDGSLVNILGALEMFRESNGDVAAWDYLFYVEHLDLRLGAAAEEILHSDSNDDRNIQRVEAMRQYAATVAA